ncbi:MAG: tyrosine-type recombinase/integrase [Acidimicrobiia bacterium]
MADIRKRASASGTRWDVRYRDESRRQRKKTFERKVDAQRFANSVETDLVRGDWIDPDRGRELFGQWADTWLDTIGDRKPKTRESYESIVSKHLRPRFGRAPIASIDYPTVLAYVAELRAAGVAPKTIRNIRDVMRLIFKLAVRSGALKSNPVEDVAVGQTQRGEMVFLEPEQIMSLAREVEQPPPRYRRGERQVDGYPEYGLFVRFAAFTGLRAGELVALRVKDVRMLQRRVYVHQSASEAYGQLQIVATKTYERRSVPIPKSLIDDLARNIAGLGQDEFVWQSPQGGPFRYSNWMKRHFKPAVERSAAPDTTRFHDLRHTYAAMLIGQGAHPRAIMERMGHSTITVTLDNYGHLFPKLDEALDDALDSVYQASAIGAATPLDARAPVRALDQRTSLP